MSDMFSRRDAAKYLNSYFGVGVLAFALLCDKGVTGGDRILGAAGLVFVVEALGLGAEGPGLGVEGAALDVEGVALDVEGVVLDVEGVALGVEDLALGVEGAALGVRGIEPMLGLENSLEMYLISDRYRTYSGEVCFLL